MELQDTIVAVSTPPGRGGIGIVRLSGPQARRVAAAVLGLAPDWKWTPWQARLARLPDREGNAIDQVIVTYYAAPRSYTAEDVVEIACHGAPVLLAFAVERAVEEGARLAEAGEFTLRAFVNGRIDLPQAEAVRDLIEATTLYQARVAARQMEGSLSRRIAPLKNALLELIALLEAGIDFADDDVPVASSEEIGGRIAALQVELDRLLASFAYGKLVHAGFTLAIVGRPNSGKSSLFNRLLQQDRAIVTDIAGTTRDLVSETASIGGIPVRLVDTAGIRSGQDPIERMGIERSYQAMADADLTIVVIDLSQPLEAADTALVEHARSQGRCLVVGNKCDLPRRAAGCEHLPAVSALTGEGVETLRRTILDSLAPGGEALAEAGFLTSIRHQQLLQDSATALEKCRLALEAGLPHEMLLLDLYATLAPVDALTGATTADDILHRIFATFCIGK